MNETLHSRRRFIKQMTVAGAATGVLPAMTFATQGARPKLRAGVVGAGSRGRGAMENIREAARIAGVDVEFVAVADVIAHATSQAGRAFGVPEQHRFVGFDAYRKLLEVPMDLVLLCTPPNFRPLHFEACVAAGRHCFIEKPVAVDAPGARRMYQAGEEAARKGLSVVAGTQRRHMSGYQANAHAIREGAIGRIVGGTVMWCQNQLWVRRRNPGESDAHYLARNWVNFLETSGDHIVEQHMHNIDVANWFIGHPPRTALGFGGRAHRQTGNQYDYFSIDFDYGDDCHIHSMCRQVNGTYTRQGEFLTGTEGSVQGGGRMTRFDRASINLPAYETHANGMVQEHVVLLRSIINGEGVNETRSVTDATLAAIMGRISAYTGQIIRWGDLAVNKNSPWYNQSLVPAAEDFEKDGLAMPEEEVAPIPGKA